MGHSITAWRQICLQESRSNQNVHLPRFALPCMQPHYHQLPEHELTVINLIWVKILYSLWIMYHSKFKSGYVTTLICMLYSCEKFLLQIKRTSHIMCIALVHMHWLLIGSTLSGQQYPNWMTYSLGWGVNRRVWFQFGHGQTCFIWTLLKNMPFEKNWSGSS